MATVNQPSARPTRKWFAARVTAIATLAVAIIQTGWNDPTQIVAVGLVAEALISYLVPNEATNTPVV